MRCDLPGYVMSLERSDAVKGQQMLRHQQIGFQLKVEGQVMSSNCTISNSQALPAFSIDMTSDIGLDAPFSFGEVIENR